MEMKLTISLILMLIVVFMPTVIWLSLKQVHSPWWLENILSTPFIILVIYSVLMLLLIHFISYLHCTGYFLINFFLAIFLNNTDSLNHMTTLNHKECIAPVIFFQFNIKYTEKEDEINELIEHLVGRKYHLITLQGVSQQSKQEIVKKLSPHYPYFIRGESEHPYVHSDQLIFSLYAFSSIKYYKSDNMSYLISSQWQLPFGEISLYTLHPPSPRSEKLWQTRNQTLYQLKYALKDSPTKNVLVIGDLNISKNSSRIKLLTQGMNTEFVNSWPKNNYVLSFFGLAIDHFWVAKPANICFRERINKFSWSDHYAVKTQVDYKK